jgi:hypothetical protein
MIDNETAPKPVQKQREPSQAQTPAMIADTLGETAESPRQNIVRIVQALGRTQSCQLLAKALEIEENGGMMLADNSRRRTVGGIFFHLAYTTGKPKPGKTLQKPQFKKPKQANDTQNAKPETQKPQQPAIIFSWDDRITIVKEAEQEKGNATTVKITLVGRPGKILDKGQFIVTMMESTKVPALPKGLPTPTSMTTKYAVYVAAKQWKKVAEAIQDPEDSLIIEGFPKTDPEVSAIAVFTTNITTKKQQIAKRQPQQA